MKTKDPHTVGIRELKQRLSYYLGIAQRGRPLSITRRGHAILTISTPRQWAVDPELDARLEELEREGFLTRGSGGPIGLHPRITLRGKPISETVLEDRR